MKYNGWRDMVIIFKALIYSSFARSCIYLWFIHRFKGVNIFLISRKKRKKNETLNT